MGNLWGEKTQYLSAIGSYFLGLAIFALALTTLYTPALRAEPYIAIREGYKCSKCHVNITGGGKRTDFGNIYVQTRLAATYINWPHVDEDSESGAEIVGADSPSSNFFSGRINDFFSIGGDFRGLLQYSKTPNQTPDDTFNLRKSTIYLQVDMVPDHALLYWVAPGGGDAREIFGLLKGFPQQFYIKVGQFFLPYGLRIQDDTAFIRSETGFNYFSIDQGVEIGFEPGSWTLSTAVTNGVGGPNDNNKEKMVTASGAYVQKSYRVGASYSRNKPAAEASTIIYGIFGGYHFGRFTLLGEVDTIIIKEPASSEIEELAALLEVNFLFARGMNFKLSYDYLDPDRDINEDERERYSIIYEPFIMQFVQIRSGIRINEAIPQNDEWNTDEIFIELHLFF